jgi:threonine dehydratase
MRIDQAGIEATHTRIRPHIRTTPLLEIEGSELGLDIGPLLLKLELVQHTGSFKPRGAFASLIGRAVPAAGVAAASGGNHGAAVAYAAGRLGIPARIFVPTVASPAKIERIRSYGAELEVGGGRYVDALGACEAYIARSGALSVHAYDQPGTLLGQGTLGLEIERQAGMAGTGGLDTLLVAVGGGGLIGGIAAWLGGRVKVVGVEPEGAPTLHMALQAGRPVDAPMGSIAADSLAPRQVGGLMFPIAQAHVERVALVSDDAIRAAQRLLWDRLRLVAEPGGAAALAALVSGAYRPTRSERVCVLVCGGNTSAVDFSR